jgi:parallel beta-helix repeat protein
MLTVFVQPANSQMAFKEIVILPDGSIIENYTAQNGTSVHDPNPSVPIARNGDNYTFTRDVYGHLIIQKDDVVIDGAGHKLILEGYGSYAISAGTRNFSRNPEFVGTNNILLTNIEIEDFGYGIELSGSNNVVSGISLTRGNIISAVAVWASGSNNVVQNCRITETQGIGIYISGSGVNISGNYLADNDAAIYFQSNSATLRNNNFTNNREAFHFASVFQGVPPTSDAIDSSNTVDGKPVYCWVNERNKTVPPEAGYVVLKNCANIIVQGLTVSSNTINAKYNANGIYLVSTKDSIVRNNNLNVGAGINIVHCSENVVITENHLGEGGVSLTSASNISVTKNSFTVDGVSLVGSEENHISENTLSKCAVGISLRSSNRNHIVKNNITNCNIGISIFSSNNNTIVGNNFVDNYKQFSQEHYTTQWPIDTYYQSVNNNWDGNYWTGYNGTDTNLDGIGDTPFVLDDANQDNLPLMKPGAIPSTHVVVENPNNANSSTVNTHDGGNTATQSAESFPASQTLVLTVAATVIAVGVLIYFKKYKKPVIAVKEKS